MFLKKYEERLVLWKDFRNNLEHCENPLEELYRFWKHAPSVNIAADPYNEQTWPDPWEMIKENCYCEFVILLAYWYTLQLTTRFSESKFEIHIVYSKQKSEKHYLLSVDDVYLSNKQIINQSFFNHEWVLEKKYTLPQIH